jgi:glycerol-3-phosphate dehydrogenase
LARELSIDVLIFGGGIAGLWTLARLRREGYSCLLIEHDALGSGQTIASQGIIHGGIKYALTGQASRASKAIAGMPAIWEDCLAGRGELDLRAARVLSERQYLWTSAGIGSRLVGVAASRAIRTPVRSIAEGDRPECFAGAPRGVDVYSVEERVLDPQSVVHALGELSGVSLVRCDLSRVRIDHSTQTGPRVTLESRSGPVTISPRRIILAAGEGNAALLGTLGLSSISDAPQHVGQQLRPLHMLMVRGRLPAVFGHCVGLADKPRITITSQSDATDNTIWYVGGEIAESGTERDGPTQIAAAKSEVAACLPWIDLSATQWAAFRANRAEGTIGPRRNQRPDEPLVHAASPHVLLTYPTKLAFAPLLASQVLESLRSSNVTPRSPTSPDAFAEFDRPAPAALPWERKEVAWS